MEPLRRDTDFAVDQVLRGGYVVCCADRPDVVLVATGSEVALAQSCVPLLTQLGIQASVVSLPCWEVFLQQDQVYQDCVLPPGVKRVSIEAGTTLGWEDLLGTNTLSIGIDHFGTSAPGADLAIEFGFTPEIITKKVTAWFQRKL